MSPILTNLLSKLPASRQCSLPLLKDFQRESANELQQKFIEKTPIETILQQHSVHFDQLLTACWQLCSADKHPCCLIAIGGYGHKLLFPCPDLDILIVTLLTVSQTLEKVQAVYVTFNLFYGLHNAITKLMKKYYRAVEESNETIDMQLPMKVHFFILKLFCTSILSKENDYDI